LLVEGLLEDVWRGDLVCCLIPVSFVCGGGAGGGGACDGVGVGLTFWTCFYVDVGWGSLEGSGRGV